MKTILFWLFFSSIFALSYSQLPLFSSNQNTHFLHGLAQAGMGYLNNDWLANTTNAFPLFTVLVKWTYTIFGKWMFYVFYFAILALYACVVVRLVSMIFSVDHRFKSMYILLTFIAITFFHSAVFRFLSIKTNIYMGWNLQNGVAGQYMLGPVFQPSTFAVFLLVSVYLFLTNRPYLAVLSACIAALFHSSYLLSTAILTAIYMGMVFKEERKITKPLLMGMLALLLVSPFLLYIYLSFIAPSSLEAAAAAQEILINYRLPHHAKVSEWFNKGVLYQIVIVITALFLIRKTKLFTILSAAFITILCLTILQTFLKNETLTLIFPWRMSVLIVPLSSCIIAAYFVSAILNKFKANLQQFQPALYLFIGFMSIFLPLSGIYFVRNDINTWPNEKDITTENMEMMNYITESKSSNHLYLIPTSMENFRVYTGAPILVDWKSLPYKNEEVIEWYSRETLANDFYESDDKVACDKLEEIVLKYGVTHVVVNNKPILKCDSVFKLHFSNGYNVYQVNKEVVTRRKLTKKAKERQL